MLPGTWFETTIRHEIDTAPDAALQVGFQVEIMIVCGGAVELDENINIAVDAHLIARGGSEERQSFNAVACSDLVQMLR